MGAFVNVVLGELRASGWLRFRLEEVSIMRDEPGPREGKAVSGFNLIKAEVERC